MGEAIARKRLIKWLMVALALSGVALAVACSSTPTPTPTPAPTPSPTILPAREWSLEAVRVEDSTVTITLRVFAGIDVTATIDGKGPDEVRPNLPFIEYVFRDTPSGRQTVEVRDVLGFTETIEIAVPAPTPSPVGQPRQVAVGREFTLKAGESVEVAKAYFLVTFNGVTQDSRCPSDVVCVRAGSVTAELETKASDGQNAILKLTVGDEGSATAQFGNYSITLTGVQPYPVSTSTIDPREYEVTLLVQAK